MTNITANIEAFTNPGSLPWLVLPQGTCTPLVHAHAGRTQRNGDRRVFSCLIHIDIKDDKIWIQHDGTEGCVANQLVELGVPAQAT